jgi:ClpA/ClpB-like protein
MFERYTEKARRVIFFARYEASQFGSPVIDTEHLLLGILRDDERIRRMLPADAPEAIRAQIDARYEVREKVSISVDLPLSNAAKRVLAYGAEEAERMNHRHIGSEHLFLGLLREENSLAAKLLEPFGVKLEQFRTKVGVMGAYEAAEGGLSARERGMATTPRVIITIHGLPFKVEDVLGEVRRCRLHRWHWRKASWEARDCVIERQSGKVSLDITLAADSVNFEVIKGGWKKDHCTICCWELFESQDDHGTGYTNGREWLCVECYDKFWARPDFISGSYSDIT